METTVIINDKSRIDNVLSSLRKTASDLAMKSENEALLADVVAMLRGVKRPCTYTPEEFATILAEADEDYKSGRFVTQNELRTRYGL